MDGTTHLLGKLPNFLPQTLHFLVIHLGCILLWYLQTPLCSCKASNVSFKSSMWSLRYQMLRLVLAMDTILVSSIVHTLFTTKLIPIRYSFVYNSGGLPFIEDRI